MPGSSWLLESEVSRFPGLWCLPHPGSCPSLGLGEGLPETPALRCWTKVGRPIRWERKLRGRGQAGDSSAPGCVCALLLEKEQPTVSPLRPSARPRPWNPRCWPKTLRGALEVAAASGDPSVCAAPLQSQKRRWLGQERARLSGT